MRSKLSLILACGLGAAGCELIVNFDPARLDGGGDAQADVTTDIVHDTGSDAGPGDSGPGDTGPGDTGPTDTGPTDTGPTDTGPTDTGPMDTGPADTGVDAGVDVGTDTGPADTGPSLVPMNGCTPATATDMTAAGASRNITFPGTLAIPGYTPPCITVRVGQTVTWTPNAGVDFSAHPLTPGIVTGSTTSTEAGNPIPTTSTGMTAAMATFSAQGSWGFYCAFHYPEGMMGTVYVVP